jgi:hypothetical protein
MNQRQSVQFRLTASRTDTSIWRVLMQSTADRQTDIQSTDSTYVLEDSAQVGTEYRHGQLCRCVYGRESRLQQTGTWSAAAWPPRRLCYRPTVMCRPLPLSVPSFMQGKILRTFRKCYYFFLLFPKLLIHGVSFCLYALYLFWTF